MRLWLPLGFLIALAGTLVACGGSSSPAATASKGPAEPSTSVATAVPSSTAASGPESALAASMLMTTDDLPEDYLRRPRKPADEPAKLASACGRVTQPGMTGRADGDAFLFDGLSPAISEVVAVFATAEDAAASVTAAPAYVACALGAINGGTLDSEKVRFSAAKSTPVSIDAAGDASYASQVQATETFAGQDAPGIAQYTLVIANKGRVVYELFVVGSGVPVDPDEMTDIAQSAATHIRQQ